MTTAMEYNYFDTSAFLKFYIEENGSDIVQALFDNIDNNTIIVSDLTILESRSAIRRRERAGTISAEQVATVLEQINEDIEERIIVRSISSTTMNEAARLIDAYSLRTLDALQLAECLIVRNDAYPMTIFVCADIRLLDAASQEGLDILNPLDAS